MVLGKLSAQELADELAMFFEDLKSLFICKRKRVSAETTYELTLVFEPSKIYPYLLTTVRTLQRDWDRRPSLNVVSSPLSTPSLPR
jgi:hypothetical protein